MTQPDVTDAELVRRFREGERDAFSEIVERYQHRVFTLCLRWMGDREIAAEVAQDVFLALYRSLPGFRGDALLSTWIVRVTINHCKNRRLYRRRRQEERHEPLDGEPDDEGPARQLPSDDPGPDAPLRARQAGDLLQRGLDSLEEETRQIVVLRDVQDLSYEEIGDLLGLPRGTVKSRLHRARAELAHILSRWMGREDL
jgi:RNA polymerase sigma-70 factor (ECF subfamily)